MTLTCVDSGFTGGENMYEPSASVEMGELEAPHDVETIDSIPGDW